MTPYEPRARWDATYVRPHSATLLRLLRSTLAPTLPDGVAATTIWPTWPLERIAEELSVGTGQTFLDAGCGQGETTAWIAKHTGASLVGLDPSPIALSHAERHAAHELEVGRWRFMEGSYDRIPLGDAGVDGALAIDSLHFAADQAAAFTELARVLRPSGRLVITLPVLSAAGPPVAFLAAAGFDVKSLEETPERVTRMHAYARALRDHEDQLVEEMGVEPVQELLAMDIARHAATTDHYLIVAERGTAMG